MRVTHPIRGRAKNITIEEKFPGGWKAFVDDVPNRTLCTDGQVARVGFQWPEDAKAYIANLERYGIKYFEKGKAIDLAVVEQHCGPNAPCDWIEYGYVEIDNDPGKRVEACELVGCPFEDLATPEGWEYQNSMSRASMYVAPDQIDKSLKFLRHEDGADVYLNLVTDEEVYVGRTGDLWPDNEILSGSKESLPNNMSGESFMEFIDMDKYRLLNEMCENDGIHKVLGALVHIYHEKNNRGEDNEDYEYIRDQLAIAGANIYNNTNEPYPEQH